MSEYYKLYSTAPQEPRQQKESAVYHLLESLDIPYQRMDHPEAMTIEACDEISRTFETPMCKNLFLCNRQKTDFYLLLMPGDKPFKTKDLSKQINSARLSFADASYMEEYLNITPGSVSIMGLMNDTGNHVRLLIDRDLLDKEYLAFHPCINTSSVKASTEDILTKFLQEVHHTYTVVSL